MCLALRLAARLAEALFNGGESSSFPRSVCDRWAALRAAREWEAWLEAAAARVDVDDALGIAAGSDALLDRLRDPKGVQEELAEMERQLAAQFKASESSMLLLVCSFVWPGPGCQD